MKKEWVQVFIAIAVALAAGAVIRVADTPAQLGSLGEWVSGIGSFMAAGIALWIADTQRRHANEQFSQERLHAAEMAAEERRFASEALVEERRYQETLARMEREEAVLRGKRSDLRSAQWILDNISPGIRNYLHYSKSAERNPENYKAYVSSLLSNKTIIHASNVLNSVTFSTFSDYRIHRGLSHVIWSWNIHLSSVESLLKDLNWTAEDVNKMMLLDNMRDACSSFYYATLVIASETDPISEEVQREVDVWIDDVFKGLEV